MSSSLARQEGLADLLQKGLDQDLSAVGRDYRRESGDVRHKLTA
jgi:hypothetical protein